MAGNPVKFRCFRCNQLLGISRSKIGAQIDCPKCRTSLVVPDPNDPVFTPLPRTGAASSSSSTVDALLDIRPEDIRVEPGHPQRSPLAETEEPEYEEAEYEEPEPEPPPPAHPEPQTAAAVAVAVGPEPKPAEAAVVPPIELNLNAPRRSAARSPVLARLSDVVLPRSVVLAWSLFVLVAVGMAFLAGLFAGHFIWRVH